MLRSSSSPTPPSPSRLGFLFLLLIALPHRIFSSSSSCSDHHSPCPPFQSPPSFPFSLSRGCGHPSFQIRCSPHNNRSYLTINSFSFDIKGVISNNCLLLSPSNPSSLPTSPIDLSGSPFRFSNATCSLLSSLPHTLSTLTASSSSPSSWHGRFLHNPTLILRGCSSSSTKRLRAQTNEVQVLDSIISFLQSGIQVQWDPSSDPYFKNCSICRQTTPSGSCGFNESDLSNHFLCLVPHEDYPNRRRRANHVVLLGTTLFAVTCFVALIVSAATAFRRNKNKGIEKSGVDLSSSESMLRSFLRRHQFQLRSPVYSYEQLRDSTEGFDPKRKIGDGGFGSVYLAHMDDGRAVAVKRLHRHHPATTNNKSFCNEILILSSIHHPNLVRLHGYCCDPRGLLLVYDYVPNGTLADHLHEWRKRPSLSWQVRVDIALQTSIALEYLHFSVKPPVVHRDITSSNIFIDKDMKIKVGDFGLSRLLSLANDSCSSLSGNRSSSSSECVWTGPQGTPGYLDPDYHHSFRLTEKSDVYSFGVVLLELITGMKAVDVKRDKREIGLADMVVCKIQVGELHKVVDPVVIRENQSMATVEAVAELAFRCLAGDKDDRPDARELVDELKRIRSRTT